MKWLTVLIIVFPWTAIADLARDLDNLVGYTIVASTTIEGWYDDEKRETGSFQGCSHGRVIVFTGNQTLTCSEYGYQYAYRPTAVILAKEFTYQEKTFYDIKMVVGNDIYDMRR